MTLVTAYLLLEPKTVECGSGHARNPQGLKCGWCDKTYAVEYESSCTDPRDLAAVLKGAQAMATSEHVSGHRKAKIEMANRIPPQQPRVSTA
jgi:hypothetical protein